MQRAHSTGEAVLEADSGCKLSQLPFPRYYLDFEGIDLPVPRWAGVRPYEQVPFQWSCHIESAAGEFQHREFLDLTGDDPSLPCIAAPLEAIPPDGVGPIFVYSRTYEECRLRELKRSASATCACACATDRPARRPFMVAVVCFVAGCR